jgi:hypothetical protein
MDNTSFFPVSFGKFQRENYASTCPHYRSKIVGVFSRPLSKTSSLTTNIFWWYMHFFYGGLCCPIVGSWALVVPYLCFRFHIFDKPILEKYVYKVERQPCDAPPHSLKDKKCKNGSIEDMSLKVKTTEKRIEVCSLTHNTSRVKGCDGAPRLGLGRVTSWSIIHTNLHKPNNKLVNV